MNSITEIKLIYWVTVHCRNPRAAGAALVWNPVPLLEVRAGYRDAGNGGSQAEGGLRVNYSFGTPLHEQLDYRNVGAPSNTTNRHAFVDRNYDIVMAYREQASKIRITAMPVSGLSGTLVTLMATVDSRYPIEKVEWSGDAELRRTSASGVWAAALSFLNFR